MMSFPRAAAISSSLLVFTLAALKIYDRFCCVVPSFWAKSTCLIPIPCRILFNSCPFIIVCVCVVYDFLQKILAKRFVSFTKKLFTFAV